MKSYLSRAYKNLHSGFTLVELLIVIGLLGAIALIVIAAINPIEQANRARDARFNADSSQIVSAIERYYASHQTFPWMDCSGCTAIANDEFSFTGAGSVGVGVCGASCTENGLLITSNEINNNYLSRDWITKPTDQGTGTQQDQKIFVGKGEGASAAVYACYVPQSSSNREKAVTDKTVRALSFDATTGLITDNSDNAQCQTAAGAGWKDGTCVLCVPN